MTTVNVQPNKNVIENSIQILEIVIVARHSRVCCRLPEEARPRRVASHQAPNWRTWYNYVSFLLVSIYLSSLLTYAISIDGDLGSNEILVSKDRTIAIVDGSGVVWYATLSLCFGNQCESYCFFFSLVAIDVV